MMKKAFTLAEVLITLMIIGIVAALTIPSVISNYQQQEFKTGLKKAVSVLNEAIQTNIAVDGETPYNFLDDEHKSYAILRYLKKNMSVLKDAQEFKVPANISNPQPRSDNKNNNYAFYTTDGMRFETSSAIYKLYSGYEFVSSIDNCGSKGVIENTKYDINPCIITVDVNGDKKPNPASISYEYWANGDINNIYYSEYKYPSPNDKKITDVFNILITDDRAIPFGVVAQRAMYSK